LRLSSLAAALARRRNRELAPQHAARRGIETRDPVAHAAVATRRPCSHLGNIEMEVADRIGLKLPLGGFVALCFWQATDPMALEAPMQGRSREVRDDRL
jgi:hypothetical protein